MRVPPSIVIFAALLPYLVPARIVQGINGNVVAAAPLKLLNRHYQDGEKLSYHMKATNKGFLGTTSYEADAIGVVKIDSNGRFYEEYKWTNLIVNTKHIVLPAASLNYRQSLSLAPGATGYGWPFADLNRVHPRLTGPILDLYNFYVDLQLAMAQTNLTHAGDHVFLKYGKPAFWTHGSTVLGEDSIDFDITLEKIDRTNQIATILVRHVPPEKPQIKLPAEWMHMPVADTPNNWVQVTKNGSYKIVVGIVVGICLLLLFLLSRLRNSRRRWIVRASFFLVAGLLILFIMVVPYFRYMAMVGRETFDCEIKVSLVNGKILSATMDNPVEVVARPCTDETATKCGISFRGHFRRQIEIY
jgi:hypothetical protein